MQLNIWSVLLIAFASQNIFLLAVFATRPASNKRAATWLLLLLTTTLLILISNLLSATHIYRLAPKVTDFARGMVLLFGPLLYSYAVALLDKNRPFKTSDLLHFLPYAIARIFILKQSFRITDEMARASIDALITTGVPTSPAGAIWFVAYALHLGFYCFLLHNKLQQSYQSEEEHLIIPIAQRVQWLKKLWRILGAIALLFSLIAVLVLFTGRYHIIGNYIYNFVLAGFVYLIAFQHIKDQNIVVSGFSGKYRSQKTDTAQTEAIHARLLELFEKEKVFTDADLNLPALAKLTDAPVHLVSQVINTQFGKSLSDLLNEYRIREFLERVNDPQFAHYSIIGLAYDVGYNSKSTFNAAFKKLTGKTPSAYLKEKDKPSS